MVLYILEEKFHTTETNLGRARNRCQPLISRKLTTQKRESLNEVNLADSFVFEFIVYFLRNSLGKVAASAETKDLIGHDYKTSKHKGVQREERNVDAEHSGKPVSTGRPLN